MKKLKTILLENEEFLIQRILHYAIERGYAKYTSSLEEAWRMSISGISESIINKIDESDEIPELGPDENFIDDPISAFGVLEAKKHRDRGINLSMFLGLLKYYKQVYIDLILEKFNKQEEIEKYRLFIERCFDRVEIAFCSEWVSTPHDELINDLQEKNRTMANEKNSYLSAFESISDPVILLDKEFNVVNINLAAAQLLNPTSTPGMEYYFESLAKKKGIVEIKESLHGSSLKVIGQNILYVFPWLDNVMAKAPTFSFFYKSFECEAKIGKEEKLFEAKFSKMLDVSGKFMPFILTLRDITEERATQRAVREGEESLRRLIEVSPLPIVIADYKGNFLQTNKKFTEVFRLEKEDIQNIEMWWEYACPDSEYREYIKTSWNERIEEAIKNQSSIEPVERIVSIEGQPTQIVQFHISAVEGKIIVVFNDLTEIRKVQEDIDQIFNISADIICIANLEGKFIRINPAASQLLGYSKKELLSQSFFEFVHPDDREKTLAVLEEDLKSGKTVLHFENRYICKDGSIKWLEWVSKPVLESNITFAIGRDMTKRKVTEEELMNQKILFETTFNAISDALVITNTDREIILANKGVEKTFKYKPEEVLGKTTQILYSSEHKFNAAGEQYYAKTAKSTQGLFIMEYKDNEGRIFPGETFGTKLYDNQGEWIGNLGIMRDVTEREAVERALKENEEKYRLLFENMASGFALHEMIYDENDNPIDYRYLEVNPAFERLTGLTSSFVLGKTVKEVLPGTELFWIENAAKVAKTGLPFNFINYSSELAKYYDTYYFSPKQGQFAVIFRDITEKKHSEENLKASERMLAAVLDTIPVRVFWKDTDLRYMGCNSQFAMDAGLNSFKDVRGKTDYELPWKNTYAKRFANDDMQIMEAGEPKLFYEENIKNYKGEGRWLTTSKIPLRDENNNVYGILGCYEDITDRKQAEKELQKYAKAQEVLLREVNHRVKNNLAALISILHKEEDRAVKDKGRAYKPLLHDLIGRVNGLSTVHSLLSASGWRPLKLSELCEQVIGAVLRGVRSSKNIKLFIAPSKIEIDSNQAHHLTLVLNELATNSVKHASRENFTLEVVVELSSEENIITLTYKDNGPGYPQEILEENFSNVNIGFELIRGIIIQSLDGKINFTNDSGATTELIFELEEIELLEGT